jgi:hypothetical protein
MAEALDPRSKARLERALWLARLVMLWEQGAAVWGPWLLAIGSIATAGLWGLFALVPPIAHATLVTLALAAALVFSVLGARTIRWPTREDTRKRLEADSRLVHAPLSALDDTPASGDPALWALHRAQAEQAVRATRVGRPRAGLAAADPFALRYVLVVGAVLALWARGPERAPDALSAFRPVMQAAHVTAALGGRGVTAVGGLFGSPASPATAKAR